VELERVAAAWLWWAIIGDAIVNKLTKWALGALVLIVVVQGVAIYRAHRALYDANLAAANERAAGDRTRNRLVGQVLVAERLAGQLRVDLEVAHRRPGLVPQVGVGVAIGGKTVIDTSAATVTADTATLVLESRLDARDSLGVSVAIHSEVSGLARPAAPPTAWTRFEVTREPLRLDVSLSCQRAAHGADAVVQVSGPRWAAIDITRPEVQPEVCNPRPPAWHPFEIKVPSVPVAGGLLLVGWLLHDILRR